MFLEALLCSSMFLSSLSVFFGVLNPLTALLNFSGELEESLTGLLTTFDEGDSVGVRVGGSDETEV